MFGLFFYVALGTAPVYAALTENDTAARERYGLVGIRERADAVGAQVTLASKPDLGTTILVDLEVSQ